MHPKVNIYITQTILDQKHRKICNLMWLTKFYDSFSNPTPILEKSEKNQYFEMCQTYISMAQRKTMLTPLLAKNAFMRNL